MAGALRIGHQLLGLSVEHMSTLFLVHGVVSIEKYILCTLGSIWIRKVFVPDPHLMYCAPKQFRCVFVACVSGLEVGWCVY